MTRYLITGARIADPASDRLYEADLRIADGFIAGIGDLDPSGEEEVIDAHGRLLAPALIDMRAHSATPGGAASAERLSQTASAAASGGIGTLILAPNGACGLSSPEDIDWLDAQALTLPVRVHGAGLATANGELNEIGLMLRAGALYLSDGGQPIADSRLVRRALSYAAGFEAWVSLRPEDAHLIADTVAHESDLSSRLGLPARPGVSERFGVERDTGLAELTGGRLILDRITTADGIAAARAARQRGLEVAITVPVSHLVFNEVDAGNFDARYRLDPPLRSEEDRLALIDALARGVVDAVVSAHTAVGSVAKANPFADAVPGTTSLHALLPALLTLVETGQLDLLSALRPVTSGPADLLGLAQGRIEEGAPADLILIDPSAPVVLGDGAVRGGAKSAFAGRRLFGKILMSFIEGAIILQP
ncbi:dihydroorotase [Marinicauda pacifica]|jgi:dihydroorotase|uniref:Dihydroorotase n=1 Tax=Marinicauda pacifica TaxID=1133559 RepID=A0A4S2H7Q8_9PROT|nr:dihydroorotase [Marinicauda pacifica]TGY91850.1 dihydroorotase [Marinicauda pacifica]GGE50285.1 dihydroorotase [Marinicauda pacifica]